MADYTDAETFKALIATSDRPVLAQFSADWCAPCRAIAPMMEEVTAEFKGRVTVLKLNVDEAGSPKGDYNIRSIPTLVLIKRGADPSRFEGQLTLSRVSAFLDTHLEGAS